MSFGGFGAARFGGGGGALGSRPGGGLPFAGIPPELQDGVDKLLADEPDHGEPTARVRPQHRRARRRNLTLRALSCPPLAARGRRAAAARASSASPTRRARR